MGKTIVDTMNYRYNNPTIALALDEQIVALFLQQERERNVREQFALWASMSKENIENKLTNMIDSKSKEQVLTK